MTDAYPLAWPAGWPRATDRKRAKFSKKSGNNWEAGYRPNKPLTIGEGTERIIAELGALGVRNGTYVISSNLLLRNDGLPRSGQGEPRDPGVAVYWTVRKDPQKVMAIDIYDRVADNLAAVAATLSAMRAIERHGGAQIMERTFQGFTALPAPPSSWEILGLGRGASADAIQAAWKGAIRKVRESHPGGDHPRESEINAARDACLKEIG